MTSELSSEEPVVIYTDGACDPNPGPGGWAAVLRYGRHEKVLSGSASQTTNNRMELQAALAALQALKWPCQVELYTDSEYLHLGITDWLATWQRRGWRTSQRKPVQNQDLWRALVAQIERHQVAWHWVKGHAGSPLNERVDQLAREAIPRSAQPIDDDLGAIYLYTRASCLGQAGPGGWGVVIRRGETLTSLSQGYPQTTANQLEIQAAIEGLSTLDKPSRVHVYTVSKYLHQGITRWMAGWRARGWQTKAGEPVRNRELWLTLDEAQSSHEVHWHHLSGVERPSESDQAAALASEAAYHQKESLAPLNGESEAGKSQSLV